MEDPYPVGGWGIQEYSSEEEGGKLSWIVNKGLSVVKKVLVTGFVISSVPLVLPPLVVISVIGFACSVPSGLFLASYAFTDKLMGNLLPGSSGPHFLLDCGTQYSDEEVENNGEDVGLKGLRKKGEYEDEKEEEAEGIEVKIESLREEEEKPVADESWGQLPVDEVHAAVIVDVAGDEISGRTIGQEGAPAFAVRDVVVKSSLNRDTEEGEELARETRGLLEKIREEGMTDNGDDEKQSVEIGLPSENKNDYGYVRIEKPLREIEHKIENKIDEPTGSSTGSVDVAPEERKPIEPTEGSFGKTENILEAEKSKGVIVGTTNSSSASKKPKVEKPFVLEEGRENENVTDNVQDYQLNKEKEIVISTNADAREIADESGFDLYDNANLDTVKGEHECNGSARISSQKDLGMAVNEVMYDETEIWQQINTMRKIAGYKAAKHATCFEELKALYLFTGVAPPASFKDPSDILEINDKLRFLMSVVGVKQ